MHSKENIPLLHKIKLT